MDSYTGFADVYDTLMDNIPYDEWVAYIFTLLKEHQVTTGTIVELGCGTGNITKELAHKGYSMIGIDNSPDMLSFAKAKQTDKDPDILYLLQDMRKLHLEKPVDAVISICDSLNYMLGASDLTTVFQAVHQCLCPMGIFIFDFKPLYFYKEILSDHIFAEDRDDVSLIWENFFDEESHIHEYHLNIFKRKNKERSDFQKYQEIHKQYAYTLKEIRECVKASGLKWIAAYDAFTKKPPKRNSQRIYVIAEKSINRSS